MSILLLVNIDAHNFLSFPVLLGNWNGLGVFERREAALWRDFGLLSEYKTQRCFFWFLSVKSAEQLVMYLFHLSHLVSAEQIFKDTQESPPCASLSCPILSWKRFRLSNRDLLAATHTVQILEGLCRKIYFTSESLKLTLMWKLS